MERLDITSVVDLPCGDMNFIQHVDLDNASYIGCDIVPEIVADIHMRILIDHQKE